MSIGWPCAQKRSLIQNCGHACATRGSVIPGSTRMLPVGECILHSRTFEKIVSAECRNEVAAATAPQIRRTRATSFAESSSELGARIFAVEFRDETGANLGRTHCFALISVGAITKSLVVHHLYHFQHASLAFRSALGQKR